MNIKEKERIIDKAEFYGNEKIKAHVSTIPKGTFKNGLFISKLTDQQYFWFSELDTKIPIRLFLSEIHDINDYQEERK